MESFGTIAAQKGTKEAYRDCSTQPKSVQSLALLLAVFTGDIVRIY